MLKGLIDKMAKLGKKEMRHPVSRIPHPVSANDESYLTTTLIPSECAENSGAYRHWIVVIPFE